MRRSAASTLSWLLFVVGTLACLVLAYGAYSLASYSWAQVVGYRSPYVHEEVSPELRAAEATPAPPIARHVVLVIVDGMRLDVSRSEMAGLNKLRSYGSDLTLTVPQPSLSYPNWTTILTGAPQTISGVTTNWYEGRVLAPTIMDQAEAAGRKVAVVGPTDFEALYGLKNGPTVSLRPWPKSGYLSATLIDDALRISKEATPDLLVVHLPDLDEAGHRYGGASSQYKAVAARIDGDISRLVSALQGDQTAFVIVADHGQIDTGGHGGWENSVVNVPGIFTGAGIKLGTGVGDLAQIAPTVSVLEGLSPPPYAADIALRSVFSTTAPAVFSADAKHHDAFGRYYASVVTGGQSTVAYADAVRSGASPDALAAAVTAERLAAERDARLPIALSMWGAALLVVAAIGLASWRALVAALAGTATYVVLYNAAFFLVHHYQWSLSAFNKDTQVQAFMNGRMLEAALAALAGVAVAAIVYPLLRHEPKGPRVPTFLGGWLALAPAASLVMLATLASQVAWFLWMWGAQVTWILPDFMWGFKYDLDLVQMTAVGATALLAPLVTYLIGRYHPKVT